MAMALTAAERQKRYRETRKLAENGYRQVNIWLSTEAYLALKRLAQRDGVTQREMLERLLVDAQNKVIAQLSDNELSAYLSLSN
jgi:UDP-N-acetyl-D-mannosaminuronate dehydrogenase